jgi:hypothetical protein
LDSETWVKQSPSKLVGILAGLKHLKDLNQAPHPLVEDQAVIASWGQAGFAHYSGVSRTLSAAGDDTLHKVIEVLETVSQPFINAEMMALGPNASADAQQQFAGGHIHNMRSTNVGARRDDAAMLSHHLADGGLAPMLMRAHPSASLLPK